MTRMDECQLPGVPRMAEGAAEMEPQPLLKRFKRLLARPWNYWVKKWMKQGYYRYGRGKSAPTRVASTAPRLQAGDWVRVRSREEIQATLDPWKELKGCAFLEYMWQYCGTTQRVLKPVQRFLDERDYKVKKVRGVVLLEGAICQGTPVFGQCDRGCHLFWREEWLEKIDAPAT